MTTADARPSPRISRISWVVMVLAALIAGFALSVPQAEAAKKKPRVVAISPFAAATMVRLGVKPIAIGETIGGERRKPKALKRTPILKLSHPNGPNLEVMAKLRPDIVFSSSRWSKGKPALKRLGIRVIDVDPLNVSQVYRHVTKIGQVLKRQRQAARVKKQIRNQIRSATGFSGQRPKVLVVLGIGNTAMAFLGNSWGGQIAKLAGASLVTGGATNKGGFARLSDEVVVAQNPDVIVVVPHGSTEDRGKVYDYIKGNEAWKTTNAIKNGKVFVSTDNELLQAGPDVGPVIRSVRKNFITK